MGSCQNIEAALRDPCNCDCNCTENQNHSNHRNQIKKRNDELKFVYIKEYEGKQVNQIA